MDPRHAKPMSTFQKEKNFKGIFLGFAETKKCDKTSSNVQSTLI
jgi:hypothetical protein